MCISSTGLALALGFLVLIGGCHSPTPPTGTDGKPHAQNNDAPASPPPVTPVASDSMDAPESDFLKESQTAHSAPPQRVGSKEDLAKGEQLYQANCAKCHGIEGDGQGPLAADLSTKPQNFTKGEYKFRSTMSGELPTDTDLLRTISEGIPGTAMESYQDLSQDERMFLVTYLKSLSPRFLKSPQGTPIIFPEGGPGTPKSLAHGRQLYNEMQCAACHGDQGKGDGELANDLTDTSGKTIQPADLTRKRLKSGDNTKDIYRTIMTGLDGTPMPSYGYSLAPEEGWDLALYIHSLSK